MREIKKRSQSFNGEIESENTTELCKTNGIDKQEKNPEQNAKHVRELLVELVRRLKEGKKGE